jgi:flavin reductase (DIM6/NTAB) family NADH-FMN oxidoreductase RutF
LTPIEAKTVKSPLIEECIMNIECKVVDSFETGDHTVFVGRPTAIWCNEDAIKKGGIDRRYKRKDSMIHATDLLP